MTALRHHPRQPLIVKQQIDNTWRCADGRELIDMSGASLTQTLLLGASLPAAPGTFVTPSSGFESTFKLQVEASLLAQLPWAGGCLWASSGSDAIEQAIWAVDLMAANEHGRGLSAIVVRRGGYHGNTLLGRSLSSRGTDTTRVREINRTVVHILDEGARAREKDFLVLLQQLWHSRKISSPALVLLEPFPTTGRRFVADAERLAQLLAWCREQGIYVAFDEVAGGVYRHGQFSICERLAADLHPLVTVLSKGLTCGAYPLSVAVFSDTLAAAVRKTPSKPLSFTYGLTEYAAAVLITTLSTYDELRRRRVFADRRACMQSLSADLEALGLEVEHTDTTVRIAGPRSQIADLVSRLAADGMWVYSANASFRKSAEDEDQFVELGFMHICPPLNLKREIVEQQCRAVHKTIAAALSDRGLPESATQCRQPAA